MLIKFFQDSCFCILIFWSFSFLQLSLSDIPNDYGDDDSLFEDDDVFEDDFLDILNENETSPISDDTKTMQNLTETNNEISKYPLRSV